MEKKIHIQHVLLSLQPGGLENGVVNVVNRLSAERFTSSICCLKQAGEFASRVNPGIPIHEMGWRGGNDLRLPFRLARLFRKTRPDIVHTRNAESFYYGFIGAKLAGIDCVVHSEHGRTFNDSALRFWVQRWFSAHTRAIFSVSAQLKRELVKQIGLPEKSIQVLYNGVDLKRFGSSDQATARQQIGLNKTDLVIGSVGRLVSVKNYRLLLEAVAALGRNDVITVLVGDGPERTALEELAKSLGIHDKVRFLGHRNDITSLLPMMDIFVLPSLNEGLSNTLLESMASSVATIASDIGGNPEIITHESDGYLFASDNQQALTAQLQRLCADPALRRRFGEAARARIERDFSMEAMIACYENFYTEALNRADTLSCRE